MDFGFAISTFVNSILCSTLVIYIGTLVYRQKFNFKKLSNLATILIYMMFSFSTAYIPDKFITTLACTISLILLYKVIFKKDWIESLFTAIITYIIILIIETIIGSILIYSSSIIGINVMNSITGSIVANIIILLPTAIISRLLQKYIRQVINFTYVNYDKFIILIFVFSFLILAITLNKFDTRNWFISVDFYINLVIFIILLAIIVFIILQIRHYDNFMNKYLQLAEYSKVNDEVLEEYRLKSHEFKNELAIIKTMTPARNNELNEYLDNLLDKNKTTKYGWINEVKYIQLPGLKGLLNYKIAEFDSLGLKTKIVISKSLKNISFNNLNLKDKDNLYSIIGVFLDNAKEAAQNSKKKEISIEITSSDDKINIKIANTYKGNIETEKLNNYRYSTKGKERGIGLFLVQKIVNKTDLFETKNEVTKEYFIQTLIINTK